MSTWWPALIVALATSLALTPVMRQIALRTGWLDLPGAHKGHARPTPLLGGLSVHVAFVLSLLVSQGLPDTADLASLIGGATLLVGVGLWDDRNQLSAPVKLLATAVAAVVLVAGGTRWSLGVPASAATLMSIVWVIAITNAFNLLDHIDGIAAGVGGIAALGFLAIAAGSGDSQSAALAAALAGACLGFLYLNLPPARIFLGDAGSLPIGFLLAALSLRSIPQVSDGLQIALLPPLVLIVPIFDTLVVTVSRLRRGRNPLTTPGIDHIGHRLAAAGAGRMGALAIVYCVGIAAAALAVWASATPPPDAVLAGIVGALAAVGALLLVRSRGGP